jgi:nitrite reductase/ring-hydroxylating ferredoxin subunit
MAWEAIISVDRCRPGGGTFVEFGGRELAVFLLDDPERVEVIDNTCPHAGGNLSGGEVLGGVVTCPWHQWAFALSTGVCTHSDRARVRRYEAEIRDGVIWVELP